MKLIAPLSAVLILAAGCLSHSSADFDEDVPGEVIEENIPAGAELGGWLDFMTFGNSFGAFSNAHGEFWSSIDSDVAGDPTDDFAVAPLDGCVPLLDGFPRLERVVERRDLGEAVRVESGELGFALDRFDHVDRGSIYMEFGGPRVPLVPLRIYDVTSDAFEWLGAFQAAPLLSVTSPAGLASGRFVATRSSALEFTWEPVGADAIAFWFASDRDAGGLVCRAADDGAFAIDPSDLALLPASGSLNLGAMTYNARLVDDRVVAIRSFTWFAANYAL